MQVGVEEDGQTRIRERYVISAPLAGNLQRITLDPGDPITAGQTLLAAIDPTDPSMLDVRAIAQAEARVRASEAAMLQAEAGYERAQAELDFAEKDLARIRELDAPGTLGDEELDRAELRQQTAVQDLRTARFAVDVARFELEQVQAALLHTRPGDSTTQPTDASAQLRLIAPVDGVVLRLLQESSAVVTPGTPLLEVGDPRDLEAVVDVLSTDAVQIEPGAPATIERWGGGEPLRAAVRLVEPAAFTKFSALGVEEQRVNVILDLLTPFDQRQSLGDAYRIEANITLWQADDVVQVPTGALFRRGDQWSVFVIEEGLAREVPVQIGQRNGLVAEVLEGLEPGQQVIAYPSDRVSEGTQVVAR
jgi:HlyD family secretion protein